MSLKAVNQIFPNSECGLTQLRIGFLFQLATVGPEPATDDRRCIAPSTLVTCNVPQRPHILRILCLRTQQRIL
jgi:hypothetical protein